MAEYALCQFFQHKLSFEYKSYWNDSTLIYKLSQRSIQQDSYKNKWENDRIKYCFVSIQVNRFVNIVLWWEHTALNEKAILLLKKLFCVEENEYCFFILKTWNILFKLTHVRIGLN